MAIDFSTDHGQRALEQLQTEPVIWLTTVGASGTPQPNPVWFLYQDGAIYVYNQTIAARLKNIARNEHVSLNFNTAPDGEDVTVLTGTAVVDEAYAKVIENADYVAKYADGMDHIGSSPERMSTEYPVVIRITPTTLRGWV